MLDHLKRLEHLRGTHQHPALLNPSDANNAAYAQALARLKRWQHRRLALTYQDLLADKRYQLAAEFFLNEVYGSMETLNPSARDKDLVRMYPTMKRLLPQSAFETVTNALALDVLSEEFDQALAGVLGSQPINAKSYAAAFRKVGLKKARLDQVQLMHDVGHGLDAVVKKPILYTTLILLRGPSKLAGLTNMQRFLEAGFKAFRQMKGADYFLATIAARETALITAIFASEEINFPFEE